MSATELPLSDIWITISLFCLNLPKLQVLFLKDFVQDFYCIGRKMGKPKGNTKGKSNVDLLWWRYTIGNNLEESTYNSAKLKMQIESSGWSGKSGKSALCSLLKTVFLLFMHTPRILGNTVIIEEYLKNLK